MTPKEKAQELLSISLGVTFSTEEEKKIAHYFQAMNILEEVVSALNCDYNPRELFAPSHTAFYWQQVKEEIKKI